VITYEEKGEMINLTEIFQMERFHRHFTGLFAKEREYAKTWIFNRAKAVQIDCGVMIRNIASMV
jgi:hypothetical protein